MLGLMFASGAIQGIINTVKYGDSCKAMDNAKDELHETADKWGSLITEEDIDIHKLQESREQILNSISAMKKATSNTEIEFKKQIRLTQINLAVLIFSIVVLLTLKRFQIIEKIIEIFK